MPDGLQTVFQAIWGHLWLDILGLELEDVGRGLTGVYSAKVKFVMTVSHMSKGHGSLGRGYP